MALWCKCWRSRRSNRSRDSPGIDTGQQQTHTQALVCALPALLLTQNSLLDLFRTQTRDQRR